MTGRELDPDGTDSYHAEHPWEQVGHELYVSPRDRTRLNWPPVPAKPAGSYEARQWKRLPKSPPRAPKWARTFGPGFTS